MQEESLRKKEDKKNNLQIVKKKMHFCVDPRQSSRHFDPTFSVEGEQNFVIKQGFVFRRGTVFPKLFKFVDQKSTKTFYADHRTFKNNSADHREEKNCKKYIPIIKTLP